MQNSKLQRRFILTGLTILLLLDLALAVFTARMADARQNPGGTVAVQSRQVALVQADIDRATEIKKKIPANLKHLDDFEGALAPSSSGYSAISAELNEVAKKNHLLIDDQKFHQKDVVGHNLTELEIETSVTGDYGGIVRFLNALQRSKDVYIVNSLNLETQNLAQGRSSDVLKVSLHLKTYFRKV